MAITGSKFSNLTAQQKADMRDAIRGYKVYTAILHQEGTANPTATVLEDTIMDGSWQRNDVGDYSYIAINAFTLSKVFCFATIQNRNYEPTNIVIGCISADEIRMNTFIPLDALYDEFDIYVEIRKYL